MFDVDNEGQDMDNFVKDQWLVSLVNIQMDANNDPYWFSHSGSISKAVYFKSLSLKTIFKDR